MNQSMNQSMNQWINESREANQASVSIKVTIISTLRNIKVTSRWKNRQKVNKVTKYVWGLGFRV
jgi:hypothetical protein